jgi:aerobic carbon-monoxide dehydrogenase large subunit
MDYLLPSALDVPEFEIEYIETRTPDNPLGVKGLGESGTCFSPAAVDTAVADALGVEVNRFALGPKDVYELLTEAGLA